MLCQGFVVPPASQVPALLTPAFPATEYVASVSATEPSQDWQLGVGSPPWGRDGVQAGGIWIFWCWLASVFQLWLLGVFFSSSTNALLIMKAGGKGLQQCWFWWDGRCMLLIEVGSSVKKLLVPGCAFTTNGTVLVLHIWLFCPFCCRCAWLGALPWALLCASSFFVMLRITGQKGAALVRGSWWGLRENDCALVGVGDCEIPGYVSYSWFALKWLRKLLSATHSSKVSEEHLAGWSYCTETLLFPHLLSLIWPFWYRFVCKPLREAFSLFLPAACKALKWAFFPDVSPGAAPSAGDCVIFTFSQPGTGALHSTTVLFYCAGKVLSEGIAAHTTLGPWKRFQGDGNYDFITVLFSMAVIKNLHGSAENY